MPSSVRFGQATIGYALTRAALRRSKLTGNRPLPPSFNFFLMIMPGAQNPTDQRHELRPQSTLLSYSLEWSFKTLAISTILSVRLRVGTLIDEIVAHNLSEGSREAKLGYKLHVA